MARPTPLSGYPEWLPQERLAEQQVLATLREVFELHGYAPVETRAVEPLEQLLRKGETDKEIYLLRRLQAGDEGDDPADTAGLGLHFDLTVPFARYVLENAGRLHFPLRRYQIQKAWRGERPQEGRYREFLQADIDVVGRATLPFHYEVELPLVVAEALSRLPIPPVRISVNNRKVLEGFFRGLGVPDRPAALRAVDKLDKVGPGDVTRLLTERAGCTGAQAEAVLALAAVRSPDPSVVERVRALGVKDDLLDEGLDELARVVTAAAEHAPGLVVADLRIARGLDYYTGTVYETTLLGHEQLGSVCSGGRYDDLASSGAERYPGVGVSVGVTRLLGRLFGRRLLTASRSVPTCVLVALPDEASRPGCDRVAAALRARGVPTEVSPEPSRYGKQIRYAERRGIPYVWFPPAGSDDPVPDAATGPAGPPADGAAAPGAHEVRDIRSGDQHPADPASWSPPLTDLHPSLVGPEDGQPAAQPALEESP